MTEAQALVHSDGTVCDLAIYSMRCRVAEALGYGNLLKRWTIADVPQSCHGEVGRWLSANEAHLEAFGIVDLPRRYWFALHHHGLACHHPRAYRYTYARTANFDCLACGSMVMPLPEVDEPLTDLSAPQNIYLDR